MKKFFGLLAAAALLVAPQTAEAALVLAWDDFSNPDGASPQIAAYAAPGFTGSFVTDTDIWGRTTTGGLAGLTFGSFDSTGTYTNVGGQHLSLNNGTVGFIDITVTNSTADDYVLETFNFDLGITRLNAADAWTLSVQSGALSAGIVGTGVGPAAGAATALWTDFDQSLTGLADNVLEAGESVVFRLDLAQNGTLGAASAQHAYLDNLAFQGSVVTAIPEPSSLALLGVVGVGIFVRRRKK